MDNALMAVIWCDPTTDAEWLNKRFGVSMQHAKRLTARRAAEVAHQERKTR